MMTIKTTSWEVWCRAGGRLASFPADIAPSSETARQSAEWLARGNMISATEREPPRAIYELEEGERLEDVIEDGLIIFKRISRREAMMNY
jgi:hypothetical protein